MLDLSGLQKAVNPLANAIGYARTQSENVPQDIIRDSVIQRFEYSYELCWKFLQRWIKINVSPEDADPRTKKDLFRLAAKKQLIESPEAWFEFAEARNQTAHTYNEKNAEYVYQVALTFLPEAENLLNSLEKLNA